MMGRGNSIEVSVVLRWHPVGRVDHDPDGRLVFPGTDQVPGVYRMRLLGTPTERHYVGETNKLRRRFNHYSAPGPRQATNQRINVGNK